MYSEKYSGISYSVINHNYRNPYVQDPRITRLDVPLID